MLTKLSICGDAVNNQPNNSFELPHFHSVYSFSVQSGALKYFYWYQPFMNIIVFKYLNMENITHL